jgi:hypothetical protein
MNSNFNFLKNTTNFLLLVVFLFSGNCYGQKRIDFIQEASFKTKVKLNDSEILFFNSNDIVFYTNIKIKDTLNIFKSSGCFFTSICCNSLRNKNIKSIFIKENKIFISLFNKVYIFRIKKKLFKRRNQFILSDSIIHEYGNLTYLEKSKNLLFWNNSNYHPLDCPEKDRSKFAVYNLKKSKFENEINNNFNYYYYTHLISNFVSVSPRGNLIAFSQTYPYKVLIFDESLNLIDSLENKIEHYDSNIDVIDKYLTKSRRLNLPIQTVIRKASLNDKNVDRIVKTYFLDDTTLLVIKKFSYSNPNTKERNLDVWRLRNNKWILIVDNQPYFSHSIKKEIDGGFILQIPFLYTNQLFTDNGIYFNFRDIPFNIKNYDKLMGYFEDSYEDCSWITLYKFNYEIK